MSLIVYFICFLVLICLAYSAEIDTSSNEIRISRSSRICLENDKSKISCNLNEKLLIKSLTYESTRNGNCLNGQLSCVKQFSANTSIYSTHLQIQCNYQNQCKPSWYSYNFNPEQCIIGTTTDKNTKIRSTSVSVQYECLKFIFDPKTYKYSSSVICDNKFYTLKCFPNHHIVINSVKYSAYRGTECNTNTSSNCVMESNSELSNYCNYKSECGFIMRSKFIENCNLQSNVYQIDFYCEPGVIENQLELGKDDELNTYNAICPDNYVLIPKQMELQYYDVTINKTICKRIENSIVEKCATDNNCQLDYTNHRLICDKSEHLPNNFKFTYDCVPNFIDNMNLFKDLLSDNGPVPVYENICNSLKAIQLNSSKGYLKYNSAVIGQLNCQIFLAWSHLNPANSQSYYYKDILRFRLYLINSKRSDGDSSKYLSRRKIIDTIQLTEFIFEIKNDSNYESILFYYQIDRIEKKNQVDSYRFGISELNEVQLIGSYVRPQQRTQLTSYLWIVGVLLALLLLAIMFIILIVILKKKSDQYNAENEKQTDRVITKELITVLHKPNATAISTNLSTTEPGEIQYDNLYSDIINDEHDQDMQNFIITSSVSTLERLDYSKKGSKLPRPTEPPPALPVKIKKRSFAFN